MKVHHAQKKAINEMCQAGRLLELYKAGLDAASLNAGEESRKDLPMPEKKLQQYRPVLPGKVLYICRCVLSKRPRAKTLIPGPERWTGKTSLSVRFLDYQV